MVKLVVGSRHFPAENERALELTRVFRHRVGTAVADNWDEELLREEGLL